MRIDSYRVLYQVDDDVLVVEIRAVGDRKDIYA
jgi:mRNA-degrading endonuclease RelE of RelBE toxin-antitoxin system